MADPIIITINGEMREKPWTADPTATIEFIRPVLVRHADGTVIEPGSDGPVPVAVNGTFSIPVMPTNDPAWAPVGWTYEVVIFDGQRRYKYFAAVPYDVPGHTMPLPIPALTGSQGLAYAPINHTHSGPISGPLQLSETATPAPLADIIQMYAKDIDTNTVPRMMLPEGIEIDPIRDTSFVVRNATGGTLTKGTAVFANGVHPGSGTIPTVGLARADSKTTLPVIGVMIETLLNNAYGRVMVQGRIDNLDTSGLASGVPVYLSATTAGALTTTLPAHPNYRAVVGVVLRSHATLGALAVQQADVNGDDSGTAQNSYSIGNNQTGIKSVVLKNGFSSSLQANPTAARTWTLPDVSGTLAVGGPYLPTVAPVVTDSTFTVVRTAGGSARWRSSGGALDWEIVGDVIESRWANQDYTGVQTNLRRLRGDGNTLVGLTEFGSGAFAAEQSIDQRAGQGVAYLGAKNGLTNIGLCGYKDTPGAPTTGTWAVGNVVVATDGAYRCTVAGTPGGWIALLGSATPQPSDHNLNGWTYDPAASVFGTLAQATAGLVRVARVKMTTSVLTNIHFHLTAGGTALTSGQCFAAAYNDAGALLGPGAITASLHATGANGWGDGGFKTHPLNTPMAVQPGAWYRIAWWFNGTTGATFSRASNNGSAIVNANQTAGQAQYATANAGVTTTAPANLSGYAGDSTAWFVATS